MRRRIYADSLRTVARYRLRTGLMMLGVLVGIAALTSILTLAEGTEAKVMAEIEKMFTANNVIIRAGGAEIAAHRPTGGPVTTLLPEDLEAIADEIDAVDRWDALQMIPSEQVTYRGTTESVRIFGHTPQAEQLSGRSVAAGRYFGPAEMDGAARVALIGQTASRRLFGDEDPLGQRIRIGGAPFEIVGILEARGTDLHGLNRDDEIYVPLSTLMRRMLNVQHVLFGRMHVADPDRLADAAERMAEILRRRHDIGPDEADDFAIITPTQVRRMVAKSNRVFNVLLPLVAGFVVLVGVVVVTNLTLVSISRRRAEIGLRRAVGARTGDILAQVLVETLWVTVAGGALGVALGLWAAGLLAGHLEVSASVSWRTMAIGLAASVAAGVASALLPARRAASIDPVDALR
ncbi:MAG: ABC transporter permease [Thermoanaerobaculia bacterium]|nr:ABC transporter permease [Thermoanaerobaculia bacterium]